MTLDVFAKISEDVVSGRLSSLLVTSGSPDCVVLKLMSPLLICLLSPEVAVVKNISTVAVSFSTSAGMLVDVLSPPDVSSISPNVLVCVLMSALVVWLMPPEAVVSIVSVVTMVASMLKSPLSVSVT